MSHVHDPVIYDPGAPKIKEALKAIPLFLAAAVGWVFGSAWAIVVALATFFGLVAGTAALAASTLGFAVYYGFLKGAHIKLEPVKPRSPSMPQ